MKLMTKKKYRLAVLFVLVSMLCATSGLYGLELPKPYQVQPDYTEDARLLHALGLFKGTDLGFDLDRPSLRVEGAVMVVRLLGLEAEALSMRYNHPFTDVPSWANAHVGLMYEKGLTRGATATTFQSMEPLEGNAFATFVLRALGYSDLNGDFHWRDALNFCRKTNIIPPDEEWVMHKQFRRHEMVRIGVLALGSNLKDTSITLLERLVELGAIHRETALNEVLWFEVDEANDVYQLIHEALLHAYKDLITGDVQSDISVYLQFERSVEDERLASQLEPIYESFDSFIMLAQEAALSAVKTKLNNQLANAFEELTGLLSEFKVVYRIKD